MRLPVYIGNDVVDLSDPRTTGRSADERFLRRIFAAEEREMIASASDPDVEVWSLWAAKEAAYKVVSKLLGRPPVFEHAAFRVVWAERANEPEDMPDSMTRSGSVRYEDASGRIREVVLSLSSNGGALHAVGAGAPDGNPAEAAGTERGLARLDRSDAPWAATLEELHARFTPRELDAVRSHASAAVRLGARAHLAERLGVEERRLEIVCDPGSPGRRPPRVRLDGRPAEADVSLSHDGAWIAWALWTEVSPRSDGS